MSGTPTLDELYFLWLYGQVGSVKDRNRSRTHWNLLRQCHKTEFIWIVPNDDNRAEDGRDLRQEFIQEQQLVDVDPDWLRLGCSMFELLVGLSRRLSFEDDGDPKRWFWQLVENLNLAKYTDKVRLPVATVDEVLNRVIWRTYHPHGIGGLFPLRNPSQNQTEIELWYQLSAYLLEDD
jgi:hypothetical protein